MPDPWEEFAAGMLEVLKTEAVPLFEDGKDTLQWATMLSYDMARNWWEAASSTDPQRKRIALDNLAALKTAARIRAEAMKLKVRRRASHVFDAVIRTAVEVVARAAVGAVLRVPPPP